MVIISGYQKSAFSTRTSNTSSTTYEQLKKFKLFLNSKRKRWKKEKTKSIEFTVYLQGNYFSQVLEVNQIHPPKIKWFTSANGATIKFVEPWTHSRICKSQLNFKEEEEFIISNFRVYIWGKNQIFIVKGVTSKRKQWFMKNHIVLDYRLICGPMCVRTWPYVGPCASAHGHMSLHVPLSSK